MKEIDKLIEEARKKNKKEIFIKGHVVLENEYVEALAKMQMSGTAFRILLAVMRLTLGEGKHFTEIKDEELMEMTGMGIENEE